MLAQFHSVGTQISHSYKSGDFEAHASIQIEPGPGKDGKGMYEVVYYPFTFREFVGEVS